MAIFNSKLLVYRRVVYDIVLTTPYYHIYIYYYVYYYCICICTYIHIYIYTTKNINKYWFYSNLNWIRYCLELCLSMDCFFWENWNRKAPWSSWENLWFPVDFPLNQSILRWNQRLWWTQMIMSWNPPGNPMGFLRDIIPLKMAAFDNARYTGWVKYNIIDPGLKIA